MSKCSAADAVKMETISDSGRARFASDTGAVVARLGWLIGCRARAAAEDGRSTGGEGGAVSTKVDISNDSLAKNDGTRTGPKWCNGDLECCLDGQLSSDLAALTTTANCGQLRAVRQPLNGLSEGKFFRKQPESRFANELKRGGG